MYYISFADNVSISAHCKHHINCLSLKINQMSCIMQLFIMVSDLPITTFDDDQEMTKTHIYQLVDIMP